MLPWIAYMFFIILLFFFFLCKVHFSFFIDLWISQLIKISSSFFVIFSKGGPLNFAFVVKFYEPVPARIKTDYTR